MSGTLENTQQVSTNSNTNTIRTLPGITMPDARVLRNYIKGGVTEAVRTRAFMADFAKSVHEGTTLTTAHIVCRHPATTWFIIYALIEALDDAFGSVSDLNLVGDASYVIGYDGVPVLYLQHHAGSVQQGEIQGKTVFGILPMSLAAECHDYYGVEFGGEPPRGREYGATDVVVSRIGIQKYEVRRADLPIVSYHAAIEEMEVSIRNLRMCETIGVKTLGQLSEWRKDDLLKIRGIGRKFVWEMGALLRQHGMDFKR